MLDVTFCVWLVLVHAYGLMPLYKYGVEELCIKAIPFIQHNKA